MLERPTLLPGVCCKLDRGEDPGRGAEGAREPAAGAEKPAPDDRWTAREAVLAVAGTLPRKVVGIVPVWRPDGLAEEPGTGRMALPPDHRAVGAIAAVEARALPGPVASWFAVGTFRTGARSPAAIMPVREL